MEDLDKNYLEEIVNLKAQMETMVPGDAYNKVLEEHKRLTNEYINKRPAEKKEVPTFRKAEEIAKELINLNSSNSITDLDYITKSLEYREAMLRETGKDVFCNANQDKEDLADAQFTAEAFKTLVEQANGDSADFKHLLDKAMKDDQSILIKAKIK